MPQFCITPEDITKEEVIIKNKEAHHLINVLRVKPDQIIRVFTLEGEFFLCKISKIDGENIIAKIIKKLQPENSKIYLKLYQALIKLSRFELLLEKVTELGVDEIIPVITERTLIKPDEKKYKKLYLRWNRIILSAIKQCDSFTISKISSKLLTFKQSIDSLQQQEKGIICYEEENNLYFKNIIPTIKEKKINLFIGPEGGFSKQEIQQALDKNILPVRITKNIVRSETASILSVGLLKSLI